MWDRRSYILTTAVLGCSVERSSTASQQLLHAPRDRLAPGAFAVNLSCLRTAATTRYSEDGKLNRSDVNSVSIVKPSSALHLRRHLLFLFSLGVFLFAACACNRGSHRTLEVNYVSAPQASLRDQVATMYNHVGTVKNGERVEVLEREKRFSRIRTAAGIEGWIEQRYLVDQKTYEGIEKLTQENVNDPVQAPGVIRNDSNLHLTPGRDTEHLYQLLSGAKSLS